MQRRGSASWRFEHDDSQHLHIALFVRDAARLPVGSAADIPPPLARQAPDLRGVLPLAERPEAGKQWLGWWRRLLGQAVREARWRPADPAADPLAQLRDRLAGRDAVFDPPMFESLAGLRPLRSAVLATFGAALAWSTGPRADMPEQDRFAWSLVRDAAEQTAATLGVPIGDMNAVVHVLDVVGRWSYLAGPGCALSSAAVASDRAAARPLLHQVFGSAPGGSAAVDR